MIREKRYIKMMKRINKTLARKLYNCGYNINLVPCKCALDNNMAKTCVNIMQNNDEYNTFGNSFDAVVNEFEYYNCCYGETGKYSHFYVEEKDLESFEMCKIMC